MSPFLAQYSLLQISPASEAAAFAPDTGSADARPAAARPSPAPLMTARRASEWLSCCMISSGRIVRFYFMRFSWQLVRTQG
jgi:hypothetical protein